jgi:hypothetical protein
MRRRFHGGNLTYQRQAVRQGWVKFLKGRIDRRRVSTSVDNEKGG